MASASPAQNAAVAAIIERYNAAKGNLYGASTRQHAAQREEERVRAEVLVATPDGERRRLQDALVAFDAANSSLQTAEDNLKIATGSADVDALRQALTRRDTVSLEVVRQREAIFSATPPDQRVALQTANLARVAADEARSLFQQTAMDSHPDRILHLARMNPGAAANLAIAEAAAAGYDAPARAGGPLMLMNRGGRRYRRSNRSTRRKY